MIGDRANGMDEAIRQLRRSRSYLDAEKALGFAAVCVVGTMGRQRRRWDDNEGSHPTRLVVTMDVPHKAAAAYNRGVHSADGIYHVLAHYWLLSREHAERLTQWVYEQIEADPMLNGWVNLEPWHFEILIGMAAQRLKYATFDDDEKHRRIVAKLRKVK